jgi:hypothetical protein
MKEILFYVEKKHFPNTPNNSFSDESTHCGHIKNEINILEYLQVKRMF